jgi:hypothetical protein
LSLEHRVGLARLGEAELLTHAHLATLRRRLHLATRGIRRHLDRPAAAEAGGADLKRAAREIEVAVHAGVVVVDREVAAGPEDAAEVGDLLVRRRGHAGIAAVPNLVVGVGQTALEHARVEFSRRGSCRLR